MIISRLLTPNVTGEIGEMPACQFVLILEWLSTHVFSHHWWVISLVLNLMPHDIFLPFVLLHLLWIVPIFSTDVFLLFPFLNFGISHFLVENTVMTLMQCCLCKCQFR